MRFILVFAWLLALCFPATHAYVMGRDDRRSMSAAEAAQPELAQIGIIKISDGGYVTGILTGANCDVVITAGHAAYYWQDDDARRRRRGGLRGEFHFILAEGAPAISMHLIDSGYTNPENLNYDRHDWSVFRLSRPALQRCKLIAYTANAAGCDGILELPAHHYDRRDGLLIDTTCAIRDAPGKDLLVHDCDTKDGSSGAPLYCSGPAERRLLAINISGLGRKELVEPGEYGKPGDEFDYRNRKNYAVTIHGGFLHALEAELRASARRKTEGDVQAVSRPN